MSILPYGYKMNNGQIIIHSEQADVIRKIFSLRQDKVSSNRIADNLNENRLWKRSGLKWYHHDIIKILKDGRYCGETDFPRIISQKIYEKSHEIILNKKPDRWVNEFVKVVDSYSGKDMQLYDRTWKVPAFHHYAYFDKCSVINHATLQKTLSLVIRRIMNNTKELMLKTEEIAPSIKTKTIDKVLGEIRGKTEDQYVVRETLSKAQSIYDSVKETTRVNINEVILQIINRNDEPMKILKRIISKVIVWDEQIEVFFTSNQVIRLQYTRGRKENYDQ